jgi:hypothetical protein
MLETGGANKTGELVPNTDTGRVNLEHILPMTLSEGWAKQWNPDDAKAYQRRLGNMAIMSAKINSAVGNENFKTKKAELGKSSFHFTKMVAEYTKWDQAAIEDRQLRMAEIAAAVWSVKK